MDPTRATELLTTFTNKRVLVVGDVMLDEYVDGKIERLNPESSAPLLRAHSEHVMTGGAGNTAKNAAQLGAHAILLGVVGKDYTATKVEEAAHAEGYEAVLLSDPDRPTTRKLRYMLDGKQTLRVDFEEQNPLSESLEKQLIEKIQELVIDCDAIIVSDYAKGVITQKVSEALLRIAKEYAIPLAADVKVANASWFIGSTIMSPNWKEAREFLGMDSESKADCKDVALRLQEKMQATMFVTLGADGMCVAVAGQEPVIVPQEHVVEVFDVSGAGDTVLVVIALAMLAGATPGEAAQLGNAAGAVVVSKIGSVGLTATELTDMILHHHDHGK